MIGSVLRDASPDRRQRRTSRAHRRGVLFSPVQNRDERGQKGGEDEQAHPRAADGAKDARGASPTGRRQRGSILRRAIILSSTRSVTSASLNEVVHLDEWHQNGESDEADRAPIT